MDYFLTLWYELLDSDYSRLQLNSYKCEFPPPKQLG